MNLPEILTLDRQQIIRLLTIQGLLLLVISFIWLAANPTLPLFAVGIPPLKSVAWGSLAGLVLCGVSGLILLCYEDLRLALQFVDDLLLRHLKPRDAVYIALISSVPEEVFFRGILQNQFGIFTASLLFGLVHIPSRHLWAYGLWATCAGYYLGYLYEYSHGLLLPIMTHGIHNLLALWIWLTWRERFRATDP